VTCASELRLQKQQNGGGIIQHVHVAYTKTCPQDGVITRKTNEDASRKDGMGGKTDHDFKKGRVGPRSHLSKDYKKKESSWLLTAVSCFPTSAVYASGSVPAQVLLLAYENRQNKRRSCKRDCAGGAGS